MDCCQRMETGFGGRDQVMIEMDIVGGVIVTASEVGDGEVVC